MEKTQHTFWSFSEFLRFIYFILGACVYAYLSLCAPCSHRCLQRPKKAVRCVGIRVSPTTSGEPKSSARVESTCSCQATSPARFENAFRWQRKYLLNRCLKPADVVCFLKNTDEKQQGEKRFYLTYRLECVITGS